ncbi:hypothetical protein DESC_870068 [Desulfosarcina cetonica]|nr:hypothetical protein DESC_870068 [Desulfosarcina cetonica]
MGMRHPGTAAVHIEDVVRALNPIPDPTGPTQAVPGLRQVVHTDGRCPRILPKRRGLVVRSGFPRAADLQRRDL